MIFGKLFALASGWILKQSIKGSYAGILLADMTLSGKQSAEFVAFTIQALQLIEQADPRRFRYVQREVRYIVNTALLSGAEYRRETRRCSIDFQRYRRSPGTVEYEWYLASYAGMIVHEATHGRLYSFGIPYDETTWLRCERLCHKEQARLAAHLRSENYDFQTLVPAFDPAPWQNYRSLSRFQHVKKLIARIREVDGVGKR